MKTKAYKLCETEIPASKDYRQEFCGRSCSAKHNNARRGKRKACESCGVVLSNKASSHCAKCRKLGALLEVQRRTLAESTFDNGNARVKYAYVRKWARYTLERLGRDRKCQECGFDVVLDVCHLRPITSFPETTLLAEVNSPDNLIYLCPNHHAMLDRGLL
jgi:hypothetical protein